MGRRLLRSSLVLLVLALATPAPAQAAGVAVRIQAFYPVHDVAPDWSVPQTSNSLGYRWAPMRCDGTDALTNVGTVRFVGYATSSTLLDSARFAVNYGQDSLTLGQAWYQFMFPKLLPGVETKVVDTIQDLNSQFSQFNLRFGQVNGTNLTCGFTVNSPPNPDEGFISPRSTPVTLASNLRMQVTKYSDGTPLRCNTTDFSSRVRVELFADAPSGVYDFHAHVETAGAAGAGPNQSGDGKGGRYWEMAFTNTVLPYAGSSVRDPNQVGAIVVSFTGQHGVIHLAQQTGPGQPKNETFCSLGV